VPIIGPVVGAPLGLFAYRGFLGFDCLKTPGNLGDKLVIDCVVLNQDDHRGLSDELPVADICGIPASSMIS